MLSYMCIHIEMYTAPNTHNAAHLRALVLTEGRAAARTFIYIQMHITENLRSYVYIHLCCQIDMRTNSSVFIDV